MIRLAKRTARAVGIDPKAVLQGLLAASLRRAVRENGWSELIERLRAAVPDLRSQYSSDFPSNEYHRFWEIKLRAQHAFQVTCALEALSQVDRSSMTVVDIGDSSGTHGRYLENLAPAGTIDRFISVNLDPVAVEKIRQAGHEAILDRAENLPSHGIKADLMVCFETLEHLTDPLRFLHAIAAEDICDTMLVTVPYRRRSRFGGSHMRSPQTAMPDRLTAEQVHIYEFSPEDWALLFKFAGWRVVNLRVFRQYSNALPMRPMAALWRRYDLEGFVGVVMAKDMAISNRYTNW